MYPKGMKHQLMEMLALLFAVSFVVHLAGFWLAPLLPILMALGLLAVVGALMFGRRRR